MKINKIYKRLIQILNHNKNKISELKEELRYLDTKYLEQKIENLRQKTFYEYEIADLKNKKQQYQEMNTQLIKLICKQSKK